MTQLRYYTGIGSRSTPSDVTALMTALATKLASQGYRARSGEAEGADKAFSAGDPNCDIYLPWRGFSTKGKHQYDPALWAKAETLAGDPRVYPKFRTMAEQAERAKDPATQRKLRAILKLQTRNVFQVLGDDLATPSEFVICWTPDGAISRADYKPGVTGGTGTAINLASLHNVPVLNLKRPDHRAHLEGFLAGKHDLGRVAAAPSNMEMEL